MNKCIAPQELPEGGLLAFAEGDEWPEVTAHLACCVYCREQVQICRRELAQLRIGLYRYSCPASETLGLYQLRLLSAGEQLMVAQHVRECPHCRQELDWLARGANALPLWERVRQQVGEILEATLRPGLPVQAAPVRGGPPTMQRFGAGEVEIYFTVQPGSQVGGRTLTGRVRLRIGELPAEMEIWLWQEEEAWAAPLEAEGLFSFDNVAPGHYTLGLEWEERVVLIPKVEVT